MSDGIRNGAAAHAAEAGSEDSKAKGTVATRLNGTAAGGKGKRPRPSIGGEGVAARRASMSEEERLEKMTAAVSTLLDCLGEDHEREGLVKTPLRMAKALLDCTKVGST
jgi:GTP cyclohydrolase I